jgi:L-alanine-DL-glutamate epimerase-like enolase superfamily enzyme
MTQAAHTLSGVETAMWDLLGKAKGEPVYRLLGYQKAHKKTPYASQLFGDTPALTLAAARNARAKGFRAGKFGWGPFGRGTPALDAEHLAAAREGLGSDGILLVDAGQIWGEDVEAAAQRLPALEAAKAVWLEEPFHASALEAYGALAARSPRVRMAGGEGAHNTSMARHLIDYGRVGFIQIDCGRIGGIGPAKQIADYAVARGVTYVNHTSRRTWRQRLAAALCRPGRAHHLRISARAEAARRDISVTILPDAGAISLPDAVGLGSRSHGRAAKYSCP